jgi:hypothetical protein
VALFAAFAAYRANVRRSWRLARVAIVLVAALWLWSGIVYHKIFFASLTPAGEIFGSLFVAEAGLLLICLLQNGSTFEPAARANIAVGLVLITYALLIYPAVGLAIGHQYPAMPTFGAPCPTTIFTFGVFCLLPAVPRFAIAVPVLWTLIASYAAFGFGVHEDLGLIVAAIAAIIVRSSRHAQTTHRHDHHFARIPLRFLRHVRAGAGAGDRRTGRSRYVDR